ncbi:hypothetical protein N7492_008700 [Penicillium capsulatum]|uniref:Protein kinase domain-containing protein n=1 Tax=Penicillium capsulatum TaxID=69766 RepID=A0A9W9HRZ3_9EURO|nr:hypothetical protein N7492_008700 [Penicillium capsulatum]KAJ6106104.1 hypothetical protein N7512_009621 [Penicillium capsulatum]
MAQPQKLTSLWWPEERISATLNPKFIVSRLRPENVPRLFELPRWGEGLTSETYMEWVLLKAGRLFLTLDAIGIPDRIFALVDESCDDDDLPVAEQRVNQLVLSPDGDDPVIDTRFFHAQWRFLVRGIAEGDHVTYTGNEGVPVEGLRSIASSGLQGRDDTADKVILAGSVCRVYLRTQVQLGGPPHFFSSEEVLAEIRALRKLSHPHVVSIYGSYCVDDQICVLFTGAEADRTLHQFLTDEPLPFKRLPKEQRRQTLITWPHCLASAVSWLHARGSPHGAIRPSNVLVDPTFNVCLGQFQALDSLLAPPRVNDLESYQYSAPERWVRAAVPVQPTPSTPSNIALPSGGRTARRQKPARLALTSLNESPPPSPDFARPDSAASKGTVIRIGLPGSPSRFSFAFSSSSSSSAASSGYSEMTQSPPPKQKQLKPQRSAIWSQKAKNLISSPSITSSTSSSTSTSSKIPASIPCEKEKENENSPPMPSQSKPQSLPDSRPSTASTSTSQSPADLFSLAAITLDILTHLCKRTLSSFVSHRSARNRSAGRGGGIADASFHLPRNAVQVQSWIALLESDALKRCRRDRGSDRVFWAVPRMLIVLRALLSAEPERRPGARRVRKAFAAAIQAIPAGRGDGSGVGLHCVLPEKGDRKNGNGMEDVDGDGRDGDLQNMGRGRGTNTSDIEDHKASGLSADLMPRVQEEPLPCSSSVSEFDFGFSDAASDADTSLEDREEEAESSQLEADLADIVPVDRVSPQLSLPDLDVNITGIEGLTFRA